MPCPPKLYSLLRNKKKTNYYLIIVLADKTVDLKKLAGELLEDKLSFGSVDDLKKYLSLTLGSVSPFGLINDTGKKIKVIVDKNFFNYDKIGFHPNDNTATLVITIDDLKKFLNWCGHSALIKEI